jgi:hypothetical protein
MTVPLKANPIAANRNIAQAGHQITIRLSIQSTGIDHPARRKGIRKFIGRGIGMGHNAGGQSQIQPTTFEMHFIWKLIIGI